MNEEKIKNSIINSELSYEQILINETQKSLVFQKRKRGLRRRTVEQSEHENNPRNVETIFYSLLNFKGFIRYINFQGLTREDIRQTAIFIKYEFFPKESYIFRKFQKSDKLFGIIKGKVSIRESECIEYTKKTDISQSSYEANQLENDNREIYQYQNHYNNYNYSEYSVSNFISSNHDNNIKYHRHKKEDINANFRNLVNNLEEERLVLTSGMCFGDWGILYNIPRTASAFCLEDTHTFYLEKEYFDSILLKKFARSDLNKINFLFNKIPFLKTQGYFKRILTKITPLFFDKDQIVYTEFKKADEFYLIYQGECSIKLLPNAKNEEEITLKKNQMIHLLTIDKGGIIGLECCNENSNYDNSVIVNRDFTILLKIKMNYIQEKCKDVMTFLQPLFDKQKLILSKEREKHLKENIPSFLQNKQSLEAYQNKHKKNSQTLTPPPMPINITSILNRTICSSNTLKHQKTNLNQTRIQTYFSGISCKIINAKKDLKRKTEITSEDFNINYLHTEQKKSLTNAKMKYILKKTKKVNERNMTSHNLLKNSKHFFSLSPLKQSPNVNSTTNRTILLNKSIQKKSGNSFVFGKDIQNIMINTGQSKKKLTLYNSGRFELPLLTEY